MGVLSDRARAGVTKLNKRPDLPDWWPIMQVVGAAVVVIFLAVDLIGGRITNSHSTQTPAGYVSISTANNGGSPTPTASTAAGASVSVPLASNPSSSVSVPAGSLAMARVAASAIFTGNQSGLALATNSSFTPPASPAATVSIISMSLLSQSSTKITFAASVDLSDGVGPRTFALTVVSQKGDWAFLPGA